VLICHCKGTTDRDIRAAAGPGRACSAEIERRCGAGTACGGCRPAIEAILAELARSSREIPTARAAKR
jgi:bacterioferritin-associated ferredoxin